jgi:hypothetical protein
MRISAYVFSAAIAALPQFAIAEEPVSGNSQPSVVIQRVDNPIFAASARVNELRPEEMASIRGTGLSMTYADQGDAWHGLVGQFAIMGRNFGTGFNASQYYLLASLSSSLAGGYYGFAAYYAYLNQ